MRHLALFIVALCAACGTSNSDTVWELDKTPQKRPPAEAHVAPEPVALPVPISHCQDGQFIGSDGNAVAWQGASWFGFNTGTTAPDGLWGGGDAIAADFANIVWRQKMLGLNAVRLPFSFAQFTAPPASFVGSCADIDGPTLAAATLDPQVTGANTALAPSLAAPPPRTPGKCNDYLPATSTRDRSPLGGQILPQTNGFYVLA